MVDLRGFFINEIRYLFCAQCSRDLYCSELVLSTLSLPFDGLRAVSKVEPSKGRRGGLHNKWKATETRLGKPSST